MAGEGDEGRGDVEGRAGSQVARLDAELAERTRQKEHLESLVAHDESLIPAAERVILPDSCLALDYMLALFTDIVRGMVVYPQRMLENMEITRGVVFSQRVLLAKAREEYAGDLAVAVPHRTAVIRTMAHASGLAGGVPHRPRVLLGARLRPGGAEDVRVRVCIRVERRHRHEQENDRRAHNRERQMVHEQAPSQIAAVSHASGAVRSLSARASDSSQLEAKRALRIGTLSL